jgi:BirA family transcriptional regulator, biotin operon repressor / biotin---[acetyl-CoA-carboxylase] ligase
MRPVLVPALDVNIVWFSELDSTNAAAARMVSAWSEDEDDRLKDTVIVAGEQKAGRGRNAHTWESPPGGLYATWLGWLPVSSLGWLPLAAGVSLVAAVEDALPGGAIGLKWPNDLLADGRKLGGVLCQSRIRGDAAWAAVGFGVNIEVTPALANGGATSATCLRSSGLEAGAAEASWVIVGGFVRRLRSSLARTAELPAAWLARAVHRRGDLLRVRSGGEAVVGGFLGLGEDGALELDVGGRRRCFAAAELVGEMTGAEG